MKRSLDIPRNQISFQINYIKKTHQIRLIDVTQDEALQAGFTTRSEKGFEKENSCET